MNARKLRNPYYIKRELSYTFLYLPVPLLFLLFVIWPLIQAIYFSMMDWDGISATYHFQGLKNYVTFFKDTYMLHSTIATMKYTIAVTTAQNMVALALALALNQKFRSRNVLRTVFFLPSLFSPLVVGYVWGFLFSDPLMKMGEVLGMGVLGDNILGNEKWAIFAAAFVTVWRSVGWTMMIYLVGLQNVLQDLCEAAAVDGAGYWKQLWHIILPMIAPTFIINFILVFERGLKDFDSIFALANGGPEDSTMTIALNIYRESFFYSRGSYGTTIGVILFIVMVILTIVQFKFFQKGEEKLE